MEIDVHELAEVVTAKIREEFEALKIFAFGEVQTVTAGVNGSYRATVVLAGSLTPTVPLDVLGDYVPASGHWVLLVYPQQRGKEKPLPFIVNQFKGAS
jgi:hypothetical protein